MKHTKQQIDDFIGRDLEAIALRVKAGVSPCDMESVIEHAQQLLSDKLRIPTIKSAPYRCCCRGYHGSVTIGG